MEEKIGNGYNREKQMIYNICGVNLEIIDKENGVSVSGGVDSGLLLYFLLKYSKNKLHIFTLCNTLKGTNTPKQSIDVVYKCAELTGNYNFQHYITYIPDNQTPKNLFDVPKEIIKDGVIYTGITANPPKEVFNTFSDSHLTNFSHRDPDIVRSYKKGIFYTPWTNIDKKKIAQIYQNYDLMDKLFPLTRSCENVENTNLDHCGNCWWCNEREWAFGTL